MRVALITGSGGLIGSESVRFFASKGFPIVGIDNDLRQTFFGEDASTRWNIQELEAEIPQYTHYFIDIRDLQKVEEVFRRFGSSIAIIIHTAAQPSHDWAARDPFTDYSVNANGTLNLLEMTRKHCPDAVFIFTSTNKVYGDTPNSLPFVELDTRWEIDPSHSYALQGIDESMSIDQSKHSLFGVSKVAADIMVQEYGRYFGMKTVCFRGGCLTGPNHSGTQLHGFLSYLMRCAITTEPYTVYGYKAKQVRDNIHSYDLVNMFWHFCQNPRPGEVYNAGGGRHSNCSMLEAIWLCEQITGNSINWNYAETQRSGDHIWWISNISKFKRDYPNWDYKYDLEETLKEIFRGYTNRVETMAWRIEDRPNYRNHWNNG